MWKSFQFFERHLVQGEQGGPHPFFQDINVTCTSSGRGRLVLGDAEGRIHSIDRNLNPLTWDAYEHRVTHVHQLKLRNILVAVGNDKEDMDNTSIKFFNMDRIDVDGPHLLRMLRITKTQVVPITCLAVKEDLTEVVVGMCNGAVVSIQGDLLRDRTPRQKLLHQPGGSEMVTGLSYTSQEAATLYCVTNTKCLAFSQNDQRRFIDEHKGADVNCVAYSDEQELILADDQGVFVYELDGRGSCFGFEGNKKMLLWFRSYLCVISAQDGPNPLDSLQIYDLSNKFVAFNGSFERVTHIVAEWGSIFVLTADRRLYRLEEKDTRTKLETLFKKNHYAVAINLALRTNYDVIEIYREYGNHLYDKKDYDGAMTQYLKTIGTAHSPSRLEPSYVIRKFLDAQRIHNLTSYLQKLHEENLANSDHTTLLLNCYTKLKDVKKLNEFVQDSKLNFEIETAIRVCRQAGYHEHALFLARKHHEHNWYLKIMLEDLQKYSEALRYMYTLDFFECEKNLKKYGKALITAIPAETTQLLMELCTSYKQRLAGGAMSSASTTKAGLAKRTSNTAIPTSHGDAKALAKPPGDKTIVSSLLEKVGVEVDNEPDVVEIEELRFDEDDLSSDVALGGSSSNLHATPEDFFHVFVDQPDWLIIFLEYLIKATKPSSTTVDTLFELYLATCGEEDCKELERRGTGALPLVAESPLSAGPTIVGEDPEMPPLATPSDPLMRQALDRGREENFHSEEERDRRRQAAMTILKDPRVTFDQDHVLMLCKQHHFKEGTLHMLEKLKLYEEILVYYRELGEYNNVVKTCQRFGDAEPNLWKAALTYFVECDPASCQEELAEVLSNIDRRNLMPPLMVIDVLSRQPNITLSVIQEYISRRLQQQNQWIQEDEKQIKTYMEETEKMRQEINELKTSARVFQLHKCTSCSVPLDLPAVHFLCMHSFHQRCLNENETECPRCASKNRKILDIKRSLDGQVAQHERFAKQLDGASDGFTTVAEFFGRGLFSPSQMSS
mmetsp:Transcript_3507/g.9503  ORF Transcript_3507/g.9503 Transcript_3507/m.9503 type:complete len:1008 (+) Transcript_3507:108-3131(+)